MSKSRCEKYGCDPRINRLGVSFCPNCGKLFPFNMNHKPLHKNFLIKENEIYYNEVILKGLNK